MIPWATKPTDRSELIYEVNRRLIAEYIAVRAYGELMEASAHADSVPEAVASIQNLDEIARNHITAWCDWGSLSPREKSDQGASFSAYLDSAGVGVHVVIEALARQVYHLRADERHRCQWSFANPFVLVYATAEDGTVDSCIELSVAFWSLYAGRSSGSKSGSIVLTLLPESEVGAARELQGSLRLELYRELNETVRDYIFNVRRLLGEFLNMTLDPAGPRLLEQVGADRIVVFSDIALDTLPFGGSILGLEVPLSRLPASASAYITVNLAVESSNRGRSMRVDRRAVLLVPAKEEDERTVWARHLAIEVAAELNCIGLNAEIFDGDSADAKAIVTGILTFPKVESCRR